MQPLSPEERERILRSHPEASPQDVDEYEQLLSSRFTTDPSMPRGPGVDQQERAREERLRDLYNQLFT
jgi:hypothetical protein